MRKLNGFIYFCALTMICGVANAQIRIRIDNQEIPNAEIASIDMANSGLISIITTVGYTVEPTGTETPPPGAVAITGFSVTPLDITEGQSVAISWTSSNAKTCTASSSPVVWSGAVQTSDSASILINTAGTYVLTLTCEDDAGGSDSSSELVTVTAPVDPGTNPTTICATPELFGVTEGWESFWNQSFPAPAYQNRDKDIGKSSYVALEFNTGDTVGSGLLVSPGNTITSGVRFGSISECPGDFDVTPECEHAWGIGGGISWATNGLAGACQLKPNTTYYFNVTFIDVKASGTSTCSSYFCIATLQHVMR